MLFASQKLAEEFTVIPYPFVGRERSEIREEFMALLNSGVRPREIAEMILHAVGVLANKIKKQTNPNTSKSIESQLSDMLGRLQIFEEMFSTERKLKIK